MNTNPRFGTEKPGKLHDINMVPIVYEVLTDLDTPLSIYLKVAKSPYSYLFESVQGSEKWGRYSFIGLPARSVLRVRGNEITLTQEGEITEQYNVDDPLAWIETFAARYQVQVIEGLPRFSGGLVGYFGYDTVGYIEPRLANNDKTDPLGTPDILLMVSEEVIVFDNLSSKAYVIVHVDPTEKQKGEKRIKEIVDMFVHPDPAAPHKCAPAVQAEEKDFVSGFTQDAFERAIEKVKEYILAGDVMQVVLSQRMSIAFNGRPVDLYRALRYINPSPYMYYLDLNDFHIVGSSPEILARLEAGEVTVRPIAGTRRRGETPEQDSILEKELLSDPKECAEHLMLIDLGRNDVGRIAETGSVRVTENMVVEYYSHVMHIVSKVCGSLKQGMSAMDVQRATFPAGTVSGAPKIRAMEIIDELEPVKRGIYAGSIGYVSWCGNVDTAIAIRTAIIKDGMLHIQAGAGIVADSIPRQEWEETLNKGRAMFRAMKMAAGGLDIVRA